VTTSFVKSADTVEDSFSSAMKHKVSPDSKMSYILDRGVL